MSTVTYTRAHSLTVTLGTHVAVMQAAEAAGDAPLWHAHAVRASQLVRPLRRHARGADPRTREQARQALAYYRAQRVPASVYHGTVR